MMSNVLDIILEYTEKETLKTGFMSVMGEYREGRPPFAVTKYNVIIVKILVL